MGKCLPLLLSSVAQPIHQIQKSISSLVTMPRLIFSMGISHYRHPSRQPHACSTKQGYAHVRRMSPKEENEMNTDAGILCNGGTVEHTRSGAHCLHIAVGRQMSHTVASSAPSQLLLHPLLSPGVNATGTLWILFNLLIYLTEKMYFQYEFKKDNSEPRQMTQIRETEVFWSDEQILTFQSQRMRHLQGEPRVSPGGTCPQLCYRNWLCTLVCKLCPHP